MSWALVTGGSKRVGAEICLTLAENRHNILVHYLSSEKEAQALVLKCRSLGVSAEAIKGDFSSLESTEAFISEVNEQYPKIEVLINNVGNFILGSTLDVSILDWQNYFQTNFFAPLTLIKGFLPSIRQSQGSIINIGTAGLNSMKADTKYTAYTATKASLLWITKALARELAPYLVRVNMVSPGQLNISVDLSLDTNLLPMKRAGTSREVGEVIAFLLKKENSYLTGQNIEIAGGLGL